eukprot:Sspe_Gene.9423::Locus_3167_Transcript_1_1_Confidence_1.000_Length_10159::g.9423::m.9423
MGRRANDDGSSHNSASQAGSASSNLSGLRLSSKRRVGSTLFTTSFPIVPLLMRVDIAYPALLVKLGWAIEAFQMLAFIVNPHIAWGSVLQSLSNIVYALHLPLWDPKFADVGYNIAVGPLWFICVVMVLLIAAAATSCQTRTYKHDTRHWTFALLCALSHSISTWLLVPIADWLASFMFCKGGELWAYEESCWEGFQVLNFTLAVTGFVTVFLLAFVVGTSLYDASCFSSHPFARAHSRLDKGILLWKLAVVIVFHTFIPRGWFMWYSVFFTMSCGALAVAQIAMMPYFSESMNQRRSSAYVTLTCFGFLSLATEQLGEVVTDLNLDAMLVGCWIIPIWIIGAYLGTWRVSHEFLVHKANFCAGYYSTTPTVSCIPHHATCDPELLDVLPEKAGDESFLVSYIDRVWWSTDYELAARFVYMTSKWSHQPPSYAMLQEGCRIFRAGIEKMGASDLLILQHALFLCWHNKWNIIVLHRYVLHQLIDGILNRIETSLAVRYQSHRLMNSIKACIGLKDNVHIKIWHLAQKLHREALSHVASFWSKLLGTQVDIVSLAVLANTIMQKRDAALSEFKKVLQTSRDTKVLESYRAFLEQVMLEEDAPARSVLESVDDGATGHGHDLPKPDETERGNLRQLRRTIYAIFLLMLLLPTGILVFQVMTMKYSETSLDSVHHAGKESVLMQRLAYQSMELCVKQPPCLQGVLGAVVSADDETQGRTDTLDHAMGDLQRLNEDLQAEHYKLTAGKLQPTFPSLIALFKRPLIGLKNRIPEGPENVPGTLELVSFWNLGYEMVQTVRALYWSNITQPEVIAAYHWVRDNALTGVADAIEVSMELRVDESEEHWVIRGLALALLLLGSLLAFQMMYVVLKVIFQQINVARLNALSLCTLIPKPEVQRLANLARSRVSKIDQLNIMAEPGEEEEEKQNVLPVEESLRDTDVDDDVDHDQEMVEVGFTQKALLAFLGLVTPLNLALVILVGLLYTDGYDPYKEHRKRMEVLDLLESHRWNMRTEAQSFVQFGDAHHLVNYLELMMEDLDHGIDRKLLLRGLGEEQAQLLNEVHLHEDVLHGLEMTALRLGVTVFETARDVADGVLHHTWDYSWSHSRTLTFHYPTEETDSIRLNNTEVDLLHNKSVRGVLAREAVYGELYRSDTMNWERPLSALRASFTSDVKGETAIARARAIIIGAIVCSAVIVALLLFSAIHSAKYLRLASGCVRFNGFAVLALAIAEIVVAVLLLNSYVEFDDKCNEIFETKHEWGATARAISELTTNARGYIQQADLYYADEYYNTRTKATMLLQQRPLDGDTLENATSLFNNLLRYQDIAMTLAVWAIPGARERAKAIPGLGSYSGWDIKDEGEAVKVRYPDEQHLYTNASYDATLPPQQQLAIARSTLFNRRYEYAETQLQSIVHTAEGIQLGEQVSDSDDLEWYTTQLVVATISLSLLVLLLYTSFLVRLFFHHLNYVSRLSNYGTVKDEGKSPARRSKYSIVVVAFFVCALIALCVVDLVRFQQQVPRLDLASALERKTANTMIAATVLAYSPQTQHRQLKHVLQRHIAEVEEARNRLFYKEGPDREPTSVGQYYTSEAFLKDCASDEERAEAGKLMARGVSVALQHWLEAARAMLVIKDPAALTAQHLLLSEKVPHILDTMKAGTDVFHSESSDELAASLMWIILVYVASVLVIFIEFVVIFRPMTNELLNQDAGAKLMLRMIPQEVRDTVPAIQEFLESGTMTQEGDPTEAINEAINEMSTIPIVAIDEKGTIIKFTQAGEQVFKWSQSEVLGNNVSMLMPPGEAAVHDQWLARYRSTGERRVIGTMRRLVAMRKNKSTFPCELTLRSFRREGGAETIIAMIRDITRELELDAATRLNEAIQSMSAVPMICIDTLATVTLFNEAAEQCFGFAADEIKGQNVNLLMPEEVGRHHDAYIAAYIKTGVKKVIDRTRRVQGQRKNGEIFTLSISIKEIQSLDVGSSSLFLGFLRDASGEIAIEYQHKVNDNVSSLSPVPIICMYANGDVIKFSTAAERLWGWSKHQVEGEKINMLLPDDQAELHDAYVQNYFKSGVKKVVDTTRQLTAKHKDGTLFPVEITLNEIRKAGLPPIFVAFLRDIRDEVQDKVRAEIDDATIQLSSVPLIVISQNGIIIKFNQAASTEFKSPTEEAVGKNIKMFMPAHVARNHDQFLANYLQTGEKKIIGKKRKETAKRSDGSEFPVEISVEELTSIADSSRVFIGFVRNISDDIALSTAFAINDCVLSLSTVPIIAINQSGMVMRFSSAAEETWGYKASDVLNKSVNMLMPESVAERHDSYLATYERTGVKNVIDSTRIVTGKRASGQLFPFEISVREVRKSRVSTFIAYAMDISSTFEANRARLLYQMVSELSPLPVICISQFGVIQDVNRMALQYFGYRVEDMKGKNVKMLMPPKVAIRHDEFLSNYRRTGLKTVIDNTTRHTARKKDGVNFPVEISVREVLPEEMDPVYVAYLRDITDQVAIEHANKMSDAISDLSTIPMIAIDKQGMIIRFNRAAATCFGIQSTDAIGSNVKMLMADDIALAHDNYLREYLRTGTKHIIGTTRRTRAKRRSGEVFNVDITIKEVVKQGRDPLFIGYVRDASEDNAIEKAKMISESIVEMSSIPMIVISKTGIIEKFNPAAVGTFGWLEHSIVGKNINLLMPEPVASEHNGYLERYLRTGVAHVINTHRKVTGKHKLGKLIPLEIAVKEVRTNNGERFFIGYARSLMEEIALQKLEELNTAVTNLSTVPLISINHVGIVEMYVASCAGVFGWTEDEVLGKNVNLLMPHEEAILHDGYLARYQKTRMKHVIDTTRRVRGKRKSGETFPAEISIREVQKDGVGSKFIGYVRDVSSSYQVEMEVAVMVSIQQMSPLALITINDNGRVLQWNPAAEVAFGYKESEILGKNVKIIQPERIAAQHDGYLKKYKETRVKHIVGTTRQVAGKMKNGTEFPVEVTIREITHEGITNFVGYLRDSSYEKLLQKVTAVNDAIGTLSSVPIIAIGVDGTILKYSRAAVSTFGYDTSEAIGKNVKMLMPDDIAKKHDEYLLAYLRTRKKHVIDNVRQTTAKNKNGEEFPVELTVREIEIKGQEAVYMGYCEDISDKVDQLNDRLVSTTIKDLITVPIVAINPSCKVEIFNPAAAKLFGFTYDEVHLNNVNMLMPLEVARQHNRYVARYLEDGVKHVIDTTRRVTAQHKDGTQISVDLYVSEICNETLHMFIGFVIDKRDQQELQLGAKIGEAVTVLSPSPLVTIDAHGIIQRFNPAAELSFGFTANHVIGRNVRILMPDEVSEKHDKYIADYLSGRKPPKVVDIPSGLPVTAETKSGGVFTATLHVRRVQDAEGNCLFVGGFQDISPSA